MTRYRAWLLLLLLFAPMVARAQGLPMPIVHPGNQGGPVNLAGGMFGVGFNFIGAPTAVQKLVFTCPYVLHFPSNFTNPTSVVSCGTNPSEPDGYSIKVNGSLIGTVALSTSCAPSLSTVNSAQKTCGVNQRLEIDAPGIVSGADIGITLAFTR